MSPNHVDTVNSTFRVPPLPARKQVPSQNPRVVTSNLEKTFNSSSRPHTAVQRPVLSPLNLHQRGASSISSLPVIQSASLEPNSMSYQWPPATGYDSQNYNNAIQQSIQSSEEKDALNPALGSGQGVLDLMGMHQSGLSASISMNANNLNGQLGYSNYQNGGTYSYRPALNADTTNSSFLTPRTSAQFPPNSAYSSNPPSSIPLDTASTNGELYTPPYPTQLPNGYGTFPVNMNVPELYSIGEKPSGPIQNFQYIPSQSTYQPVPQIYQPQSQGTISPSQLGSTQNLKPTKSFSDLMMGSRASSSSSSSAEGQHDWNGNVLDDWTRSLGKVTNNDGQNSGPVDFSNLGGPSKNPMYIPPALQISPPAPGAIDDAMRQYVHAANRLAFGERKIMVMSPKVGQKSYGTEKRFLCPHPQATLIGTSWWAKAKDGCPISPLVAPRVNISLTGEQPVKDATVSWTAVNGTNLDEKINTQAVNVNDQPFVGNVAGKNLHISDNDGKRREVKALVTIKAPLKVYAGPNGWGYQKNSLQDISDERTLGVFESKEIKVISKPSKKKSSAKAGEMIIGHGSTIALFNRNSAFSGFTADANNWESFIIWLVDPNRPCGLSMAPPPHPDWPSPPANIIAPSMLVPPIRYNQTVVLQSLQTGVISPVLIVRRIESDADAVGMDGHNVDAPTAVVQGEYGGDLVSQLQKVAFEIYRTDTMDRLSKDPRYGGQWLSCVQESVSEQYVLNERRWSNVVIPQRGGSRPNSMPNTPQHRYGVLPMTPHTSSMNLPSTPSSPVSSSSSTALDYFGAHSRKSSSHSLMSPNIPEIPLPPSQSQSQTDGGPVRRHRTGSMGKNSNGPFARPLHKKRGSSSGSSEYQPNSSVTINSNSTSSESHRMFWTMDVGDVNIWSIVSTEQTTYTFYVPPYASEPVEPYAPFPVANRMLPSNLIADHTPARYNQQFTSQTEAPLLTLYGKGFIRAVDGHAHHVVYYGTSPATYNEVRCHEVMAAAEPALPPGTRTPIFLVREDGGIVIPTNLTYPPT
ncbi:uncharacterized protein L201_003486 [Kwoniella dendrophila CBS 6074]|uniref:LAG1-DNAbind-domain-containing protein n=1 Tax=Kwoniella dendrophila CBS 6074 TaxID=1295534 RepID=A0AAX4JTA6_9TREE